jgi:hypothetical protein
MTYIAFPYVQTIYDAAVLTGQMREYRNWLEENIGPQEEGWDWRFGDIVAQGVDIEDDEFALVFKLRFKV